MQPDTTINHSRGCLSNYSNSLSNHFIILTQLENVLCIDPRFPAVRNLVETLINLLNPVSNQLTPELKQCLDSLKHIQTTGECSDRWPLTAQTGRDGNPLGGRYKEYPIAAFLLQPPVLQHHKKCNPLKLLFLQAISTSKVSLAGTADILRKNIRPATSILEVIDNLPEYHTHRGYLLELDSYIKSYKGQKKSNQASQFIHVLNRLLKSILSETQKNISRPTEPDAGHKPASHQSSSPELLDNFPVGTKLSLLTLDNEEAEAGEAPHVSQVIETEQTENQSTLDEDEVESNLLQSSYWLRRHERIVPFDTSRFTTFEKVHITKMLFSSLESAECDTRMAAGLLLLVYITGIQLECVLNFTIGSDSIVTPDGHYYRKIPTPISAHKEDNLAKSDIHTLLEVLKLPLPAIMHSWLRDNDTDGKVTLLNQLNITGHQAKELIKDLVRELRQGGRFNRIKMDKFPGALGIELSLESHDPAAVYLLCAREYQAAPTLAHYTVYDEEYLTQLYLRACNKLLGNQL